MPLTYWVFSPKSAIIDYFSMRVHLVFPHMYHAICLRYSFWCFMFWPALIKKPLPGSLFDSLVVTLYFIVPGLSSLLTSIVHLGYNCYIMLLKKSTKLNRQRSHYVHLVVLFFGAVTKLLDWHPELQSGFYLAMSNF